MSVVDAATFSSEARRQLRGALAPVLRATAAAVTLGSGCSLGPEGPSVEIGRSTARALGRILRSKQRRFLPLLAAGSGAGETVFCQLHIFISGDTG